MPIETIPKFLCHESLVETVKYLGLNLDDMDAGMSKLAEYDKKQGLGSPENERSHKKYSQSD